MFIVLAALKKRRGPPQRAGLAAAVPDRWGFVPHQTLRGQAPRHQLASTTHREGPLTSVLAPFPRRGPVAQFLAFAQSATRLVHSASMSLPVLADHGSAGAL